MTTSETRTLCLREISWQTVTRGMGLARRRGISMDALVEALIEAALDVEAEELGDLS